MVNSLWEILSSFVPCIIGFVSTGIGDPKIGPFIIAFVAVFVIDLRCLLTSHYNPS